MYTKILESMKKEMLRRSYSQRTIDTYLASIQRFLDYCNKEPRKIKKADIKNYLDLLAERKMSGSSLNISLSAIKFLIEDSLHRNININLRFSKMPKTLPLFLTKEETLRLFDAIENKKHKLMVQMMYSAGLRVSELLNLRLADLDFENSYGWVRHGKGNKDRIFIIAERLKDSLKEHIDENKLAQNEHLFIGFKKNKMHPSSVRRIIEKASVKAKLTKNAHPHTLRHSFATHFIEDGYKVTDLQPLLGHNSIKTTMVYVHMANPKMLSVKSPFDSL